jgi:tRNA-2-methylthio-N6-dimethylallyladenosine synthase
MKFLIHTYGCQMNVRDSEAVEALLTAAGHEKAASETEAELIIVNSCTVRQKAEEKAVGKTGYLCATGKRVGLMGCAVKRLGEAVFTRLPRLDFAVGPRALGLIPQIVADGRFPRLELGDEGLGDALAAHASGGFQAFVTILVGCDNRCSYCIVPDVRGPEYSRPAREVVAEVRALVSRGVKEVCLLGQSVLRYGVRTPAWDAHDAPSPGGYTEAFPRLLEALAAIPGLQRIRFTSAHPKGCTDELLRAYRSFPQVCRHLHLPVQSGSDRVLADMGRRYTRAEYLAAVAKLRAFDPEFAVTTDVIVGYPGETEEDFAATRSLMAEAGFDNAFIFKYSPRPGTRSAARPDDVPKEEKERRDQVLLADQEARGLARNAALTGTVRDVLVEGPSKRNKARLSGRDSGNRIVVWDRPADAAEPAVGACVPIRILEAHAQILIGTPA